MAIPTIKATYSLDAETVKTLEQLARRWNTSKSEALRRAIRTAASIDGENGPAAAFERAVTSLNLTEASAAAWLRNIRAERRAGSKHRGF